MSSWYFWAAVREGRRIMHYLDNAATTRPSEAAVAALTRAATVCYGNPSSLHALGFEAEHELREARRSVARALGTQPERIVFTAVGPRPPT